MALARASRASFSSLRSKCDGGKNTADCGPRQAALACHEIIDSLNAQRDPPFCWRKPSPSCIGANKSELSRAPVLTSTFPPIRRR